MGDHNFLGDRPQHNGQDLGLEAHEHDHIANLETDSRVYADPPAEYPYGVSSMPSFDDSNADSFAYNWDTGAVETTRYTSDDPYDHAIQVFKSASTGRLAWRGWNGTGWEDWQAPVESGVFDGHEHDYVANLETDSRSTASLPSDYPLGFSVMPVEDSDTEGAFGYEEGIGVVQTTHWLAEDDTDRAKQVLLIYSVGTGSLAWRLWGEVAEEWSNWTNDSEGDWYGLGNVPTEFPPSAHAASHTNGTDQIANATTSTAGLESAADKTKLDGIEAGATADQAASEILTAIKTVDGSGSGLDADTLDGHDTAYFAVASDLASKADLVGGVVPTSQIPALAISDVFTVASQAAMLALTAQRGDIAVRTDFDPDRTYILSTDSPGTLADWVRVTFGDVVSVNGQTGVIVLGYADVGAASTSDTRIPTQNENDALVGTNGTPSTSNKFVTDSDSRNSNARTPTTHATTHTNGTDDVQSATASQKGLMTTAYASKLDGIESAATADMTSAEIRAALKYATDALAESASVTSFDEGVSLMLTTAGANWGPNAGEAGRVLTERSGSVGTQQFLTDNGKIFYRAYSGSWGSWIEANAWGDLTGKPSTFAPSTHATSHVTGGSDVIANAVAAGNAGLMSGTDKTKLDGIETAATQDMTAAELRTAIAGGTITTNFLDLPEQGSPSSPAADTGRFYSLDVNGKTEPEHRDSSGVTGRIFQDSYIVGQNTSGGTLNKGTVVRATGLVSTSTPTFSAADADASSTMPAIGVLMENVANNAYGRIMFQGVLTGITTTGLTAGSPLYVSGTLGTFTQTAPVYPAFRQVLGSVLSVGASGVILVNVAHFFRQVGVPISLPFFEGGTLATKTGVGRFIITANMAGTITECRVAIDTAPTGASVIVGFRKNGAASFTTVTVAASGNSGSSTGLSTAMAAGDYLTVDITQIGSTVAGSNLTAVAELMTAA